MKRLHATPICPVQVTARGSNRRTIVKKKKKNAKRNTSERYLFLFFSFLISDNTEAKIICEPPISPRRYISLLFVTRIS